MELGSNIDLSEYSFFSHHDEAPSQGKPSSWKQWIFGRKVGLLHLVSLPHWTLTSLHSSSFLCKISPHVVARSIYADRLSEVFY